jgi:translation initiation factor 2 beta subunit (eIF-2beta)/eIF-5
MKLKKCKECKKDDISVIVDDNKIVTMKCNNCPISLCVPSKSIDVTAIHWNRNN